MILGDKWGGDGSAPRGEPYGAHLMSADGDPRAFTVRIYHLETNV